MDFNDAGEQVVFGSTIPDGSFVKLQLNWKAGEADIPPNLPGMKMAPTDRGLFSTSRSSDAIGIQAELTVLEPPEYAHRKIFEWWCVAGGEVDEKGNSKAFNITKARFRAMLESATDTNPKDESPQAKANRQIADMRSLENCPFYAKLTVEIGNQRPNQDHLPPEQRQRYPDKNKIERVITPADSEYAALRAGRRVDPKPRNAPHAPAAAKGAAPAWGGGAQPTAQPAKPAWGGAAAPATAPAATQAPAQQPATPTAPAQPGRPAWATQ